MARYHFSPVPVPGLRTRRVIPPIYPQLVVLLLDPKQSCSTEQGEDCEKRELTEEDTKTGTGALVRELSRKMQGRFHFGILDGVKWAEFGEEHLINLVRCCPRLSFKSSRAVTRMCMHPPSDWP